MYEYQVGMKTKPDETLQPWKCPKCHITHNPPYLKEWDEVRQQFICSQCFKDKNKPL